MDAEDIVVFTQDSQTIRYKRTTRMDGLWSREYEQYQVPQICTNP